MLAADAAAQATGLRAGMPVTKAQVLVPGLIVQDADPAADAEALERLAVWLLRYAPIVAPDPPDGLIIDSTGADHLHGGETVMLDGLIGRLAMSGIFARGAIADTWGAAHALARFSAQPVVIAPEGHGPSVLERLPLEALRIPASTVAALRTLGFRTVGDLLAQPRAPLTLRFGPELGRRLDQALGIAAELIEPVRPADLIEVRRAFAEPIGAAETIARYIGKLVVQLCERLEESGLGARRLDLICHRVDSRAQAVRVGMATPVRDAKRLTRLLCDKIETISPGFGIEVMTLAASVAEPLERKQIVSSLVEEGTPDVSDLIDTLMNRVGERALYRLAPVASDVPERSVCRIPAMSAETGAGCPAIGRGPHAFCRPLSQSRPWRCCPTIRRCRSLGAESAAAFGAVTGRSACSANGGSAMPNWLRSATISGSRTTPANATGCFAPATARTPAQARTAGSFTGSSDEPARLR